MSQESYLEIKNVPTSISSQNMNKLAIMNDDANKENKVATIVNSKDKDGGPQYN